MLEENRRTILQLQTRLKKKNRELTDSLAVIDGYQRQFGALGTTAASSSLNSTMSALKAKQTKKVCFVFLSKSLLITGFRATAAQSKGRSCVCVQICVEIRVEIERLESWCADS